jgi:hypothetical protein
MICMYQHWSVLKVLHLLAVRGAGLHRILRKDFWGLDRGW